MSAGLRAPEPSHSSQICLRGIVTCKTRAESGKHAALVLSPAPGSSQRPVPGATPPAPNRPTDRHLVSLVHALEIDLDVGHHVLAPALLRPAAAAERVAEHVERVMMAAAPGLLLLPLEALLPETVVRLPLGRVRQDVICLGDVQEPLLGRLGLVLLRVPSRRGSAGGGKGAGWGASLADLVGVVCFAQFL